MKKKILTVLAVLGVLFSWKGSYADEGGAVADLTSFIKSIKPGQYLDTSYEFNFNNKIFVTELPKLNKAN